MARSLLALVVALCACAALSSPASAASIEWVDRCPDKPYPIPALREADAVCGWLTVPESRTSGSRDTIRLPVARLPAIGKATEAPVVYMEGGPGGAALPTAAVLVSAGLTREHEVIVMGQRGSAYAEPSLTCKEVDRFTVGSTDLLYDAPETGRKMVRAHADCRRRLERQGVDFGAYNTTENAADFADLRIALGEIKWHVLGASYGTDLALTYIRQHPQGVISATIDSVVPPERATLGVNWTSAGMGTDVLFDACRDQPSCRRRYGDVRATFVKVVDALEDDPLFLRDVLPALPGEPPERDARPVDVRVDGGALATLTFALTEVAPTEIPRLLDGLRRGDREERREVAAAYALTKMAHAGTFSYGLHNGVVCSEWLPYEPVSDVAKEGWEWFRPFPHSVVANAPQFPFMDEICDRWPVPRAPERQRAATPSDVPTLLVAGGFDALTAEAVGASVSRSLRYGTSVVFPGYGHFVLRLSVLRRRTCGPEVIRSWMRAQRDLDVRCVKELRPEPFTIDRAGRKQRNR